MRLGVNKYLFNDLNRIYNPEVNFSAIYFGKFNSDHCLINQYILQSTHVKITRVGVV